MRIEIESNEIPLYQIQEADEPELTTESDKIQYVQNQLKEIAEDLGYTYEERSRAMLGRGAIAISNNVNIIVEYGKRVSRIYVAIGKDTRKRPMYDCSTNSASIGDLSVQLQTATMIVDTIRKKLK